MQVIFYCISIISHHITCHIRDVRAHFKVGGLERKLEELEGESWYGGLGLEHLNN